MNVALQISWRRGSGPGRSCAGLDSWRARRIPSAARRLGRLFAFSLLWLWIGALPVAGQRIFPPHSTVEGKTLPEWSADWWKWAFALPGTGHPFFDETGADALRGQSGPVVLLVGVAFESGRATRSITIQDDNYLFFPINNTASVSTGENPWGGVTEQLLDGASEVIAQVIDLQCSIDGVPFTNLTYTTGAPVTKLFDHREVSPEFSIWLPQTNNVFQRFGFDLRGISDPCSSDGFWLMLAPLPTGSHRLVFRAGLGPPSNFTLEIIYHLTVQPLDVARALHTLLKSVTSAGLPPGRVRALTASLKAAQSSFDSNKLGAVIHQLRKFQHKVRAEVATLNQSLAEEWNRAAQRIIDAATRRRP